MADRGALWKTLGPGLLMAGAAVGVSHLVQSTRAGAVYGFGLLGLVLLANAAKYPAFRFGPEYAAVTGTSLLEGYRRQGAWALWLYAGVTLATMFTVQAAVSVVAAGLAKVLFGLDASAPAVAAGLIAACAALLALGRYRWLDRVNKIVFGVLTVSTVAATLLALPRIDWGATPFWPSFGDLGTADVFFFAALVGWMPSAIDIAVWHSLWTLARKDDAGHTPTRRDVVTDFHVGYLGTVILAVCFLTMGAAIMYGSGRTFAAGAGGFAAQVIDLYVATLGDWSRPLIAVCAFATMFSTTLAVVDGFPRALAGLSLRLRGPEAPWTAEDHAPAFRRAYWISLTVLAVGSVAVLFAFLTSLKAMVDLATTLSFLTAPVLAWLNHRVMHGADIPADQRPSPALRAASLAGITFLTGFALFYVWLRFLAS